MATVITNMLSAIPWIGQDFVQYFPNTIYFSDTELLISSGPLVQLAIKGRPYCSRKNKDDYPIPVDVLALFIGIVDGDGYLTVHRANKEFIGIRLVISLQLEDLSMLHQLNQLILGLGKVTELPNAGMAQYTLNISDLLYVLFPLIEEHGLMFLTNTRRTQYDLAYYVLINNVTRFINIPSHVPSANLSLPHTPIDYVNLIWFSNWVVGFTIAEGSFFVKKNGDICFSVTQRSHQILFDAFKLLFNTTKTPESHNGYIKLVLSSVKDLTTVVKFFSFSNHRPLIGLKLMSYNKWLTQISNIHRTAHIVSIKNML